MQSQRHTEYCCFPQKDRGTKASVRINKSSLFSDVVRWYSGSSETQKHGSFIGLTQIGLFRWNGFLIHSLSIVSYPVKGCRDGVCLRGCGPDGSPVKADFYSKDHQAVTPRGIEPFHCMCMDQRSPATTGRTFSPIARKHGPMPSLPFGPLHPLLSLQPLPPVGVALGPSGLTRPDPHPHAVVAFHQPRDAKQQQHPVHLLTRFLTKLAKSILPLTIPVLLLK